MRLTVGGDEMPPRLVDPLVTDRVEIADVAIVAVCEVVPPHTIAHRAPDIAEIALPSDALRRGQAVLALQDRLPPESSRRLARHVVCHAAGAEVAHRVDLLA